MKKEKIFFMIIMAVSMFMFTSIVYAEQKQKSCTTMQLGELREIAANVKVTYVPKTIVIDTPTDVETGATSYTAKYIDIKVYNMNSRIYLEVKNDAGFSAVATSDRLAKDGTVTFRQEMVDRKVNYEFLVKSTEYGCETQTLRTIKLSLPIYNAYSQLEICSEIPEYYLCQEFVTSPVDGSTFYDKVDAYKAKLLEQGDGVQEDNTGLGNKTFAKASKYKYLIVGIIVALGVVITIVIIKRKENT